MTPTATLAAFALALAVVFGGAVAVGHAVGPVGTADRAGSDSSSPAQPDGHGGTGPTSPDAGPQPPAHRSDGH